MRAAIEARFDIIHLALLPLNMICDVPCCVYHSLILIKTHFMINFSLSSVQIRFPLDDVEYFTFGFLVRVVIFHSVSLTLVTKSD